MMPAISVTMLQRVMRPARSRARAASPVNSAAARAMAEVPSARQRKRVRSLAPAPGAGIPFKTTFTRRRDLEPGPPGPEGEGDVHVAHPLAEAADRAEDVQVAVRADDRRRRPGPAPPRSGRASRCPGPRRRPRSRARGRTRGRSAGCRRISGCRPGRSRSKVKNVFGRIGERRRAVFALEVLDHVRPAEIAGRADVEVHPDDPAGRRLLAGMGLDDLLDDGLRPRIPPSELSRRRPGPSRASWPWPPMS